MHRLKCKAQNYAWGRVGSDSMVAKLQAEGEGVAIDEEKPYSEYWFGTHPNGPSSVVMEDGSTKPLQDWLLAKPDALGVKPYSEGTCLPYLFKVLSIAKALSIQAHPDKELAAKLHAERPTVYKDPNHKPEMACALTYCEVMCGFRPAPLLSKYIKSVPSLKELLGEDGEAFVKATDEGKDEKEVGALLKVAFARLMKATDEEVSKATEEHVKWNAGDEEVKWEDERNLEPHSISYRLAKKFPGDRGMYCPYFLNTFCLQPGEAVFLKANLIHAYLAGDLVECMACSDNVVRAGLTPKLRDVPTLLGMLEYELKMPDIMAGDGDAATVSYKPPVPEFALTRTTLEAGGESTLAKPPSAAIVLTVKGKAQANGAIALTPGSVFVQEAGTDLSVKAEEGGCTFFRVHVGDA